MGRMQAKEMKDLASLDQALSWHLTNNHYPPVPLTMLPVCKEAIKLANADDWYALLQLPADITYHGETHAPVNAIIKQHHLDSFLEDTNGSN